MKKGWAFFITALLGVFLLLLIAFVALNISSGISNIDWSPKPIQTQSSTPFPAVTPTPKPTALPNMAVPGLLQISDYNGAWTNLQANVTSGQIVAKVSPTWVKAWLSWVIAKNTIMNIGLPSLAGFVVIIIVIILICKFLQSSTLTQMTFGDFTSASAKVENAGICTSISTKIKENLYNFYSAKPGEIPVVTDGPVFDQSGRSKDTFDGNALTSTITFNPQRTIPQDLQLPSTVPAQISSIFDFLQKIFPPRVITISGQLEYQEEMGVGLSITFDDNVSTNIAKNITFWEKDFHLLPEKLSNENSSSEKQESKLLDLPQIKVLLTMPSSPASSGSTAPSAGKAKTSPNSKISDNEYFNRSRPLVNIASAWIFWNISESTGKRNRLEEVCGTDSVESYQWFVLFLTFYKSYQRGLQTNKEETGEINKKAKYCLLKSLEKDQHNSMANMSLAFYYVHPEVKKNDGWIFQNKYTYLLKEALKYSAPADLTNIRANYFLGDYYLNHCLETLQKKGEEIAALPDKEAKKEITQYFKNAIDGAGSKRRYIPKNARLAYEIPYLTCLIAFNKIWQVSIIRHLLAIEIQKNNIRKTPLQENNVDLIYNLACFYSILSKSERLIKSSYSFIERYFYKEDPTLVIKKPTCLSDLALRNLELAFECSCTDVLSICDEDQWLLNVRQMKEYKDIKLKYKKIASMIKPANE
jgi:hypothetical protein